MRVNLPLMRATTRSLPVLFFFVKDMITAGSRGSARADLAGDARFARLATCSKLRALYKPAVQTDILLFRECVNVALSIEIELYY